MRMVVGEPESGDDMVVVPPLKSIDFELTEEQLSKLQDAVNPLSDTDDFGINLYIRIP